MVLGMGPPPAGAYTLGAGTPKPPADPEQKNIFPPNSIFFYCQRGDMDGLLGLVKKEISYRPVSLICGTPRDTVMNMTALHVAAEAGQLEVTKYLVKQDVEISCGDKYGVTPLHLAAGGGFFEVCRVLLDARAITTSRDVMGDLPIHWAATKGHADVIKLLLQKGTPVDAKSNEGWTPLHRAAFSGQPTATQVLLDGGASPAALNRERNLPLHLACYSNAITSIEVIVKRGSFDKSLRNVFGLTPFGMCISEDAREVLRTYGADAPADKVPPQKDSAFSPGYTGQEGSQGGGTQMGGQSHQPGEQQGSNLQGQQQESAEELKPESSEGERMAKEMSLLALQKKKEHDFPDMDTPGPAPKQQGQKGAFQMFNNDFLRELTSGMERESNPYALMQEQAGPPGSNRSSQSRSSSMSRTSIRTSMQGRVGTAATPTPPPQQQQQQQQPAPSNRPAFGSSASTSRRASTTGEGRAPAGRGMHKPEATKPKAPVQRPFALSKPASPPRQQSPPGARSTGAAREEQLRAHAQKAKAQGQPTAPSATTTGQGQLSSVDREKRRSSTSNTPIVSSIGPSKFAEQMTARVLNATSHLAGREDRRSSTTNTQAEPAKWEGRERTSIDGFALQKQSSMSKLDSKLPGPNAGNRKFLERYNLNRHNLFAP